MDPDDVFDSLAADPRLADVARHAAAAERRAEAEFLESEAHLLALSKRRLPDVFVELLHRGDQVTVHVGGRAISGRIVHAAGDLAVLQGPTGTVDLNLASTVAPVVQIVERALTGGAGRAGRTSSFPKRLVEYQWASTAVELGVTGIPDPLRGRLAAVAHDHVVLTDLDDREWVVPLSAVSHARERFSS